MKKLTYLLIPSILLVIFVVWTALVKVIDIQYVGAAGFLGFYTLNTSINDIVQTLDIKTFDLLTDLMLYGAISTIVPFAVIGIVQLAKRKSLSKVDPVLYIMLAGYATMVVIYFVFEIVKINYSPLSTAEDLKASYPSSHILVFIVMLGAAVMGLLHLVKMNTALKVIINCLFVILAFLMGGLRLLSGQHYFTDVIGGLLISFTILTALNSLNRYFKSKKEEETNENE